MGDSLPDSDIVIITTLLKDMNKSLQDLHTDFGDFKGEIRASLTDTNGKLKGNHELVILKIESVVVASDLHNEILQNKINNNTDDITTIKENLKPVSSNTIKINILFGGLGSVVFGIGYIIFEKMITGG